MDYILAIDQSTAGTKGIVCRADGMLIARADLPHRQITDDRGWIEHDPMEILANAMAVCRLAVEKAGIDPGQIRALGVSNQRETIVCWDRKTGKPVYNAIVWQCGRAKAVADRLAPEAGRIRQITGLTLSPFFSAAKFTWILEHVEEAKRLSQTGRLCCGNIDAWLIWHLTEERAFKTDYSNASRTQLLNLTTLTWDEEMLYLFGLRKEMLPQICDSGSVFGHTDVGGLLPEAVPVCAVLGDSHAALYANGCHEPYMAKATFGTGTSVMMNTGSVRPARPSQDIVESLAWGIDGQVDYVLEGNINYSGAIIKWLCDNARLLKDSSESEELAKRVADTGGVYLVPAFAGLGAPYWQSDVRAILCGMTTATRREHIVRAGLEAIAYQIKDIVCAMDNYSGMPLRELCVDGGATKNGFLMDFTAGLLGIDICVSTVEELSAAGVAYLASIRTGCADKKAIFDRVRHERIVSHMTEKTGRQLYDGWKAAVSMLIK
ncbi:MAG: glycerol kinase GlpK [Lachnospiraceae bacterium]|jgi:glycerol kinase|nr:glycerol kinase GlpK [Lachnospiraceae bacterium]